MAKYWAEADHLDGDVTRKRCDGVAFSILATLDGADPTLPMMSVTAQPHPEDKAFCLERELNWFEGGMSINDEVSLHEEYYKKP